MARVNVKVNNAAIQSLFEDYGQIGRFGQRTTRAGVTHAREIVGKRTSNLARSITGNPAAGTLHYTISLGSRRPEAGWVNNGTATPIYPKTASYLKVGAREGKKVTRRPWVHGQKAQHYLERGAERALAGEGIFVILVR